MNDPSSPADLRAQGWVVAIHNDYRLQDVPHTFWLVTKGGRAVRGEGHTDAEALDAIRKQLREDAPSVNLESRGMKKAAKLVCKECRAGTEPHADGYHPGLVGCPAHEVWRSLRGELSDSEESRTDALALPPGWVWAEAMVVEMDGDKALTNIVRDSPETAAQEAWDEFNNPPSKLS